MTGSLPVHLDLLKKYYTREYRLQKHESPEKSRLSMINRIISLIVNNSLPKRYILDIGSGPQSLEKQLLQKDRKCFSVVNSHHFFTVDIAEIMKAKLLAQSKRNVEHVRANAVDLPYRSKVFGLIMSNHAIDFLRGYNPFREARRVLDDEGIGIFYFHHSSMIDFEGTFRKTDVKLFWEYLYNNKLLFNSEDEICNELTESGFNVQEITLNSDPRDTWWEVVATAD
jgi:hypothetical protein